MMEPLFQLKEIKAGYPGHPVLNGINLTLFAKERIALVGNNGAGKTTLLHTMVGFCPIQTGELIAFGETRSGDKAFHPVRLQTGILFQNSDDQLFCPTVLEDVAFGPLNLGLSEKEAYTTAEKTLQQLKLSALADRLTTRLSGGEKRMVALATILAMEPKVLLLDEPTNGLDEQTEKRLTQLLIELPQAMLFISHDRRFISQLATRAIYMEKGTVQEVVVHTHKHSHDHLHIHAPGMTDHNHDNNKA
ncbi:energy-coupling factor ABC transporter ATP-binding protein [Magnetococcales bacterium HHB-1]